MDSTTVTAGNISVTQGDAAGDSIVISADSAGYTTPSGPIVTDYFGLLKIVQGNGYEDGVTITPVGTEYTLQNVFNNVLIIQGDSLDGMPVDCSAPTGDFVNIDGTTINSSLFIFQNVLFGEGSTDADPVISGDGPGLGNNVVLIATTTGLPATADQVVVGEWTYIYQGGANNTDILGGVVDPSGIDFGTGYLDIYTGAGGGGFVLATNTLVWYGSYFGNNSVVNGGGDGNTYVQKTTPVLTWPNPADITYGTALDGTQLDATASVPGTFTYTLAAGTVLGAGNNQTLTVTFTPTDTLDYTSATATATINVLPATPTISWTNPAAIVYGTALSGTQLNATVNVAGTFTYTQAAGMVLGAGNNQTLTVTFTPTDTTDYASATAAATINVLPATPTISWANPANIVYGTALSGTQLDATAGVPGTFSYARAAGTVLRVGNNQTLSVSFTPSDTTDYTTATATATINVLPATPTISWTNPANIVYGTALSGTQLDATASVPGTFTYTPAAGPILGAGNNQTLSVVFTPTDATDYTTATATATIDVLPATPTISWTNPANIVYGTALGGTQLDATANVAGTFTYTRAAGAILGPGNNQSLSVSFTPSDTTDYTTATATATINVLPATLTISWANPANIVYGATLSATQLDATASVPGTFSYATAAGTVLGAGNNQSLSVAFTPTDTTDYTTATATATINVLPATPTISWANPAAITYGTALGATQLDATTTVPGSFVYTPAAGTVLSAGANETLSVTFTPTDTADYNSVTRTATINVSKAHTTAPPAPAFTATPISTTTVGISWPVTSTATTYYVAEFIGTTWQLIATLPKTTTAFTVVGLHPFSSYLFTVGAGNINGYTWAVAQQVTTLSHPAAPTAMVVSSTQINLTWASVPGAQAYYVAEVINGKWQLISTTTNTSLAVTGLTPATKYTFAQGMLYNNTIYWLNSPVVATTKKLFQK
ncbi:MAG: fibronectin type III domain-containing protein [Isosphaeraceae bacterium]